MSFSVSLHPPILPPNGCLLHCWQVLVKELAASFKDENEPVNDFKVRPPAACPPGPPFPSLSAFHFPRGRSLSPSRPPSLSRLQALKGVALLAGLAARMLRLGRDLLHVLGARAHLLACMLVLVF